VHFNFEMHSLFFFPNILGVFICPKKKMLAKRKAALKNHRRKSKIDLSTNLEK